MISKALMVTWATLKGGATLVCKKEMVLVLNLKLAKVARRI